MYIQVELVLPDHEDSVVKEAPLDLPDQLDQQASEERLETPVAQVLRDLQEAQEARDRLGRRDQPALGDPEDNQDRQGH